jgi:hypothetical protein
LRTVAPTRTTSPTLPPDSFSSAAGSMTPLCRPTLARLDPVFGARRAQSSGQDLAADGRRSC